jgi:hypothetical protein
MCEPNDPCCENCGHAFSEHYDDESGELIAIPNQRDHLGYDADGPIVNSKGEIVSACDIVRCSCTKFSEGEYEPNYCDDYEPSEPRNDYNDLD